MAQNQVEVSKGAGTEAAAGPDGYRSFVHGVGRISSGIDRGTDRRWIVLFMNRSTPESTSSTTRGSITTEEVKN